MIETEPVSVPIVVGLKLTLIVQMAPGLTVEAQLLVWLNVPWSLCKQAFSPFPSPLARRMNLEAKEFAMQASSTSPPVSRGRCIPIGSRGLPNSCCIVCGLCRRHSTQTQVHPWLLAAHRALCDYWFAQ